MIDDILFVSYWGEYILPSGPLGNIILGYSMDGSNYAFEQTINNISSGEKSSIFVT